MSESAVLDVTKASERGNWREIVARYQTPSRWRSGWQLANTLIPYALLWFLMYQSLQYSYLLTLALAVPTAGFLVRIFVMSHDCSHGAFFKSTRANSIVGSVLCFLCCAPYFYWKYEHGLHHSASGNLDKRGHGDIWTMTVQEYLSASWGKRLAYRVYRNPLVLFGVGSFYLFIIEYRMPPRGSNPRVRRSIWRTNAALAVTVAIMAMTIGVKAFLIIQLPIFFLTASAGAWLFYVQHQFEDVYWARNDEWDYVDGALEGSSFYRLPKVLQWFTGSIGFHHVHHLSSKIPNYNLERCHRENPIFHTAPQLTLKSSLACLRHRLWDEESKTLISFGDLRRLRAA